MTNSDAAAAETPRTKMYDLSPNMHSISNRYKTQFWLITCHKHAASADVIP